MKFYIGSLHRVIDAMGDDQISRDQGKESAEP